MYYSAESKKDYWIYSHFKITVLTFSFTHKPILVNILQMNKINMVGRIFTETDRMVDYKGLVHNNMDFTKCQGL